MTVEDMVDSAWKHALLTEKGHYEDAVSREEVMNTLIWYENGNRLNAKETIELIRKLPAVSPERPKGEWKDYQDDGYVECPFCHSLTMCGGNISELHFCFSCGAELRGSENDSN